MVWYDSPVMAIPNIKRFRPFCPTCNESYTLMAVLPKDANVDAFLTDAITRHDHKAFSDAKAGSERSQSSQAFLRTVLIVVPADLVEVGYGTLIAAHREYPRKIYFFI